MADNETTADIIAEMRRNFADGNPYYAAGLPDRLEAAHRRELARVDAVIDEAVHGYPPEDIYDKRERGNAAKLREALEAIISGYENADLCDTNYREWCHNPENVCVNVLLCKAIHEARAALSAPPRNCDVFATVDEARKAHEAICEKYGKCHHGCPLNNEEHYSAFDCFEAWLFAPATENEGGNNGK